MNLHSFYQNFDVQILVDVAGDNGDVTTSYVTPFVNGWERAVFLLVTGAVTEEIDVALYQAKDASGTDRKAITGAAITQIASATDQCVKTIEIGPGALDNSVDADGQSLFTHVQAEVTVDAAGTEAYTLILLQYRNRYPGTFTHHATYTEAVEVQ